MPATLHEMIRQLAVTQPEAPAILAPGQKILDCERLLELCEHLRRRLPALGITPGDCLALALPNGLELAAAFLALGACVTVAPWKLENATEAWHGHLAALKPKALVTLSGAAENARQAARSLGVAVIEMELAATMKAGWFDLRAADAPISTLDSSDLPWAGPEDVALVLPTSGSVGTPKMVALTQAGICISAARTARSLELSREDRSLNMVPLLNVHGLVSNLIAPLMAGGSVAVAPAFEAAHFAGWMVELQPTWYSVAPAVHHQILDHLQTTGGLPPHSRLRFVRSGSAPLPAEFLEMLEKVLSVPMIEAYGMTEVPNITGNPVRCRKAGSVGQAIVQELAILDADGNCLPSHSQGEVVVRGPTVMKGYLNDPEATAAATINGWFHTGDLGWLDEEGYLFLTGRLKEMINRGGQKVAPREVEDGLLQCAGVHQAVVFAVPHPTLGQDVAAAVVPARGQKLDAREVRRQVMRRLPGYQVPSQIIVVPEIPVLPSGKINRLALAGIFAPELAATFEPPKSANEGVVAGIFAEVLHLPSYGRADNFFSAGGDSLSAARLVSRLSAVFQVELSLSLLFEAPTVAELTIEIERRKAAGQNTAPACIPRLPRQNSAR